MKCEKRASMQTFAESPKRFEGPDSGLLLAKTLKKPLSAGDERFAVYFRISSLDEKNRRNYHAYTTKYAISTICASLGGNLYVFDNSDMILLCAGADPASLESIAHRLRDLFAGLITLVAGDKIDSICNWYNLSTQGEQFEEICRPLTDNKGMVVSRAAPQASNKKNIEPIDAEMLAKFERGLSKIDVSSFMRRQPICRILPGVATQPNIWLTRFMCALTISEIRFFPASTCWPIAGCSAT